MKRWFKDIFERRLNIRTKSNLLSISLVTATSFGIAFFVIHGQIETHYQGILMHGRSIAAILAQNAEYGIYTEDSDYLRNIIKSGTADRNIAYISILNREKHILLESVPHPPVHLPLVAKRKDIESVKSVIDSEYTDESSGQQYIEILAPVLSGTGTAVNDPLLGPNDKTIEEVIGFIHLGLSLKELHIRMNKSIMSVIVFSCSLLVIAVALTLLMTSKIASPIARLARMVREVSEGKLNHKIEVNTKDEIEELASAFNILTDRLRNYRKEIQTYQQSLLEKAERANAANVAKSEFLANMSHELRTPLNHIIGFTELVLSNNFGQLNQIQSEYLNDVLGSSRHLLSLINDILDLSKVETGKLKLELTDVNLEAVLVTTLSMFKEKAMKHNIGMLFETNGLSEVVRADERKLKQIVYNLLSNAVKFTPDGGSIRLRANLTTDHELGSGSVGPAPEQMTALPGMGEVQETEPERTNGFFARISVADTGIGIRAQDQQRIFEPFEQVENSSNRPYQGTGLGLSLTRRLVELHGGRIWVESDGEERGSTFTFVIPANISK